MIFFCIFKRYDCIRIETKTQGGSGADSGGACHSIAPGDQLAEGGGGAG